METLNSSIFNSFALISVVLPYYAPTHKCFLLLSTLCAKTRKKLNDYYCEFRNIMPRYSLVLSIECESKNRIYLPSDLFCFKFVNFTSKELPIFIDLINNLSNKRGWYFGSHYMHELLNIKDVVISSGLIKKMFHLSDILNSIKVYGSSKFSCDSKSELKLIDKIVISSLYSIIDTPEKEGCIDSNFNMIMNLSKLSNRIYQMMNIWSSDILKEYEALYKLSMKLEKLTITSLLTAVIEEYTNPEFIKGRINILTICPQLSEEITETVISNISKTRPSKLIIYINSENATNPNYIQILSGLPENISVEFQNEDAENVLAFEFKDTYIKLIDIINSKSKIIKCKSFKAKFGINELENITFLDREENSTFQDVMILYSSHKSPIKFKGIKHMLSVDEEDEISKKFPSIDCETTHKWIILIPMKNLSRTHINDEFFNKMEDTLLSRRLIRNLSKTKLFECSVKYSSIENFEAYTLILPDKCKYNFNGGYFKNYKSKERIGEVADFGDKQLDKYLPVISNMKIQSINMQEYLESSDFIFIISILSLESTKDTLKQLNLYIKYISEAIQVLDFCSKCKNIEDVKLSYETKDMTDKSIKDELDNFLLKTDVYVDINMKKSFKNNLY